MFVRCQPPALLVSSWIVLGAGQAGEGLEYEAIAFRGGVVPSDSNSRAG